MSADLADDIGGATAELNALALATERAVHETPGSTDEALRDAVRARSRGEESSLDEATRRVVDQIKSDAAAADLASLLAGGRTDDQVFEIVLVAAVAEGMTRLERATALMVATRSAPEER